MAECRVLAVDQLGLRLGELLVIEPKPLRHAGAIRDRYDIRLKRQALSNPAPVRPLEIQGNAALAAIDAQEAAALVGSDGRGVPPGVALRALDLDHVRAHVRQQHRAVRPSNVLREVNHLDSRERLGHGRIVCE